MGYYKTQFSGKINWEFGKEVIKMKLTKKDISQYRQYLMEEEKGLATVEKYVHDVTAFLNWIEDRELTKTLVLEYKAELVEKHAPTSVNASISSLNSFFTFTEQFNLKVKTLKIQKQIFAKSEVELSKVEYERLLRAAKSKKNERLYLIMQTICAIGLRVSELKFVTVDAVRKGMTQVKMKGKIRTIFLPKELCNILSRYITERKIALGCIFVTRTGKPIDRHTIWKQMKELCDDANVSREKVFPHNLRHLFARTYYTLERDIVRLADILGHSSVNTTRIYTAENGEVHRRQMQRLGLVMQI